MMNREFINDSTEVQDIIEILRLSALDGEGGMYRRVYEKGSEAEGEYISSAIYYLLTEKMFSHMHKLESDEIYHYYMGDGLELLLLYPDGTFECRVLGTHLKKGERPQIVVPGGVWQGARVVNGGKYCLAGTTMTPAYRQEEYVHGECRQLCEKYPLAAEKIKALCGNP